MRPEEELAFEVYEREPGGVADEEAVHEGRSGGVFG